MRARARERSPPRSPHDAERRAPEARRRRAEGRDWPGGAAGL